MATPQTQFEHASSENLSVLALVLGHAARNPGSPAVKDDEESLTYGELSERVAAMAAGLSSVGVGPGDRVALYLPNSAAFVIVALACLWVGAPFVPLSVEDPPDRVTRVLADCDPTLVVEPDPRHWPGVSAPLRQVDRAVDVPGILATSGPVPPVAEGPERDAYLIYTSGTTGRPKGVRTPERALRTAALSNARAIGLDESTRALCPSSFHFDGSYGNLFPTLLVGGSLVVPKREELLFVRRFFRALIEEAITHTCCSPSYLRLVLSSPQLNKMGESGLKTLGLGGEECLALDVARLWAVLPELRVFNRYGPTETTIEVTTYEVTPADVASGRIPIGPPNESVNFYLLGEDGKLVEAHDETGELCIGGSQLMNGYWGDDEFSASVLRDDIVPGETVYMTGDLVWHDDRGRYFYAGRVDDVVKRSGVRISLLEIALAIRRVKGVSAATCLMTDHDGRPGIAAFVEAPGLTEQAVLHEVGEYLPLSMLPDELFVVPQLPMSSNGKVDRARLLADAGRKKA